MCFAQPLIAIVRNSAPKLRFGSLILVVFFSCAPPSKSQQQSSSALHGIVRDAHGKPIASVIISAQPKEATTVFTARTDGEGNYSFTALREGAYTLRAQMSGYRDAAIPSIFLGPNESKNVDLTLETVKSGESQPDSFRKPQFFDEPQFTVSGVTDTTNFGIHGSDTVIRTRETFARETAALGKTPTAAPPVSATEKSLREQVEREPQSFEANWQLGKILLTNGKAGEAIPYFDRAAALNPANYENSYDLALANYEIAHYDNAREQAQTLLLHHDTAELHHLLADTQERLGNSLDAVREYQRAAELDPREPYLFDWGSELLLHHAPEPAIEVFTQGSRLFPRSARMFIGLGAASFVHGEPEQAVRHISEASALAPDDPAPYLFLGKIEMAQTSPPDALIALLQRFVTLHPESAAANYYYSVGLWKQQKNSSDANSAATVESLLRNAIRIDPSFAAAHLQLGIVYSDRGDATKAIAEYQQAIQIAQDNVSQDKAAQSKASQDENPRDMTETDVVEAHYRLLQAYRMTAQPEKAKAELQIYNQAKESARKNEQERRELRQFLYTLRDQPQKQ